MTVMDFISPFIEPIMSCLMNPLIKHIKYLVKARRNVDNMADQLEKLRALRLDLCKNIEEAKRERKESTERVNLWLKTVEKAENEVATITNKYENRRCRLFGDFSLNCCLNYKCGKRAAKVNEKMLQLETEMGDFPSITTMQPPGHGQTMPTESTLVGLDSHVEKIRNHLIDDAVRIIGIHGMGGVGKTTLLKKVNNALLEGDKLGIEYLIWVVVSKECHLEKVQAEVAKVLGLTLNDKDDESGHASSIYNYLKDRNFLLLLDDVWNYINLVEIGIPGPCSGTSSNIAIKRIQKVIFTTRLKSVCGSMRADEIIEVECLNTEDARALFKKTMGERNLQSNLGDLVEKVIDECAGLPLALTVIARAMASKTSIEEWRQAVEYLGRSQPNKVLDDDENLNMLPRLKFSYDSLKNDDLRRCFLYCSLWPEDFEIFDVDLVTFCISNEVIKNMCRRKKSLLEELECLPGGLKGLTIDVYSADALGRLTILSCASIWRLVLNGLKELTFLCLEHNILRSLQDLWVKKCHNVEVLEFVAQTCPIEILTITKLPKLKEILWRGVAPSVFLHRLRQVEIYKCDGLKSISWILRLPSLTVLEVEVCNGLECLVDEEDENRTAVAFPSLKHLELTNLPNLSCIWGPQHGLPSLESLLVLQCPKLKKLPFLSNNNSISKLRGIKCDDEWWDGLEWDDESIKASLESIRTLV